MKFTLSWLKDHIETNAPLAVIAEKLTAIGLEVESVSDPAAALKDFSVAEILSAEKHPDADKLKLCRVLSDEGELQIVCGAPNARAGLKVALAKVGTHIATGGFTIKKSKIRGVESCGMLCSAEELGLDDKSDGIIELPASATVGQPVAAALGLNDPVIDIAITPNRGDCLGVYGVARDLAAAGVGTLKPLNLPSTKSEDSSPVTVAIEDTDGCAAFVGCAIRGANNPAAPVWLQQRLKSIGLRPISTLVDITNYMTITYGRPLHVYDISKLKGNIVVRKGRAGESLAALNDKSYSLAGGECVIADESGMLGLGGIIGGMSSGVDEQTTDVFLECAWFNPARIAEGGREHGIDSDARYRFERHVDPGFLETGAAIATAMIVELCGGKASAPVIAGKAPEWKREVAFESSIVKQLGGVTLPESEIHAILKRLGFVCHPERSEGSQAIALDPSATPQDDSVWRVTPPSWRPDIEGKADIAEEVLRIHGYDNIPETPLPKPDNVVGNLLSAAQERQRQVRHLLARRGLHETYNWSFLGEDNARRFGFTDTTLKLVNPISADLSVMRPSLLPHLVDAITRNAARNADNINLFEIGPQFTSGKPGGQELIACAVRAGVAEHKQWHNNTARPVDCFDAKADAMAALAACGVAVDKLQVNRTAPQWYHPGRSGTLSLGPKLVLARFGELHPQWLQDMGCELPVVACEIMMDAIQPSRKKNTALQASDFQAAERDFAFVVDESLQAQDLLQVVGSVDRALIQQVRLFDVYQGKGMEPGKKSLALTMRLQAADRTLRDEEIEAVGKKVIEAASKLGAALRG